MVEGVRQIEAQLTHTLELVGNHRSGSAMGLPANDRNIYFGSRDAGKNFGINPQACSRVVKRLLEASKRKYWNQ